MKIQGIKKIASESKELTGFYGVGYLEVFYDRKKDRAWADYHVNHNSYSVYDDQNIIRAGRIYKKTSMTTIRETIERACALDDQKKAYWNSIESDS